MLSATKRTATPNGGTSRELSRARMQAIPNGGPPGDLDPGQPRPDARPQRAGATLNGDHKPPVLQSAGVTEASEVGQTTRDARSVVADPSEALLLILADALDDLERQRIASENRLRSLRDVKQLAGSKAETRLVELTEALKGLEHGMTLELQRAVRAHPLGPFVKRTIGLGEKQAARLIAAIGNPAWNHAENRPRRGPAELWAYCGYDPAQKRRKGVQSNWNADAKMRAYLCAESCMKHRQSPYREVYDRERAKWAERETSDGHKHAHALRVVAKEILKDLWRESQTVLATNSKVRPSAAASEQAA